MVREFIYLQDEAVTIEGIKIYGSPWQPTFQDWAFNLDRGEEIKQKWDLIPSDVDLLVTHGAPHTILDKNFQGENIGCEELLAAVRRIKPPYHLFGHIHEGYGRSVIGDTSFLNLSICDKDYLAVNSPTVFTI